MMPAIPCPPGEDYDHAHSTASALASLSAMVASFDAIMDSLEQTTEQYSKRLDLLAKRCDKSQHKIQNMKRMGEKGKAITIRSPASFPIVGVRKGGSFVNNVNDSNSAGIHYHQPSPFDCARKASNEAIVGVLHDDWQNDDGLATPSDLWLDRASGFDEGVLCRSAERVHTVPSLIYNLKMEEIEMTSEAMLKKKTGYDNSGDNEIATATSATANTETGLYESKNDSVAEDVFEQFQGSTFSTASSPWNPATGDTNIMGIHEDDASVITSSTIFTATASQQKNTIPYKYKSGNQFKVQNVEPSTPRLHAATGSQPFLCELLHDSYGVGSAPPSYDPGSYFSAPRTVSEVLYFNSDQQCYKKSNIFSEEETDLEDYGSTWEVIEVRSAANSSTKDAASIKSGVKGKRPGIESNSKPEARSKSRDTTIDDIDKTVHESEQETPVISHKNIAFTNPRIGNFQPGDSKGNLNTLQLPGKLPLHGVVSSFNED